VRLWTWQHPDWDLTSQEWRPHFGEKMWGPRVWQALEQLYPQLPPHLCPKDNVWCYLRYEHWKAFHIRTLWVVNVPDDRVHFLNATAWDVLIHQKFSEMSEKDAWKRLLVPDRTQDDRTALAPLPILREWVDDNTRFNRGPDVSNAPYEELPNSVEGAQACRLASKLRRKAP
jgi:hypothetical protein